MPACFLVPVNKRGRDTRPVCPYPFRFHIIYAGSLFVRKKIQLSGDFVDDLLLCLPGIRIEILCCLLSCCRCVFLSVLPVSVILSILFRETERFQFLNLVDHPRGQPLALRLEALDTDKLLGIELFRATCRISTAVGHLYAWESRIRQQYHP